MLQHLRASKMEGQLIADPRPQSAYPFHVAILPLLGSLKSITKLKLNAWKIVKETFVIMNTPSIGLHML